MHNYQGANPVGGLDRMANKPLITQQAVLYNAKVDTGLHEIRLGTLDNEDIPDSRKFGRLLSTGAGDAYDLLHLLPLEPTFYYRAQQLKTMSSDVFRETRISVFQTLNCSEIPVGVTQEEFEDRFVYAGQPMRAVYFGKKPSVPMGVAMLIAGSKGMWNRGRDIWFPGDKLSWRMPSINAAERDQERHSLPSDYEHPKPREAAIIEVMRFDRVHHLFRSPFTKSVAAAAQNPMGNARTYHWKRLLPGGGNGSGLTKADRSVVHIRALVQSVMFNTIAVMLAYDVDPSRVPGGGASPALDPINYGSNKKLEVLELNSVLKKMGTRNPDGSNNMPGAAMTPTELKAFNEKLLYWAGKTGMLPFAADHVQPFQNMIEFVLGMSFRSWLTQQNMQDYFAVERFFSEENKRGMYRPASVAPRAVAGDRINRQLDLSHPVGALTYAQTSFPESFLASMGEAAEALAGRVMCKSLSITEPGKLGDTYA